MSKTSNTYIEVFFVDSCNTRDLLAMSLTRLGTKKNIKRGCHESFIIIQ